MHALERFSRSINRRVEHIVFVLGLSMAVTVAVQVFFRYVLNHSLFWSEELARFFLVWLTFLGASVAYRRKVHPGIDILTTRMPGPFKRVSAIAVHILSLVLFGVMVFYGAQFAYFVRLQISPALNIPKWIIFSIIPLSGLVLMAHGLLFLVLELKGKDRDQ